MQLLYLDGEIVNEGEVGVQFGGKNLTAEAAVFTVQSSPSSGGSELGMESCSPLPSRERALYRKGFGRRVLCVRVESTEPTGRLTGSSRGLTAVGQVIYPMLIQR